MIVMRMHSAKRRPETRRERPSDRTSKERPGPSRPECEVVSEVRTYRGDESVQPIGRYDAYSGHHQSRGTLRPAVGASCPRLAFSVPESYREVRFPRSGVCMYRALFRARAQATRSCGSHRNSDAEPRRSVRSTSDKHLGSSRRATRHACGVSARSRQRWFGTHPARLCVCGWC